MICLLNLKKKLESDGFDYVILDSAPGVHYSSVNAIVVSDFTIIIAKIDNFDFDGTLNLLNGLYFCIHFVLFHKDIKKLVPVFFGFRVKKCEMLFGTALPFDINREKIRPACKQEPEDMPSIIGVAHKRRDLAEQPARCSRIARSVPVA